MSQDKSLTLTMKRILSMILAFAMILSVLPLETIRIQAAVSDKRNKNSTITVLPSEKSEGSFNSTEAEDNIRGIVQYFLETG